MGLLLGEIRRTLLLLACLLLAATGCSHTPASQKQASAHPVPAPPPMDLRTLQDQFQAVTRRVAPSVVAISATVRGGKAANIPAESLDGSRLAAALASATRSVGTGFIIDPAGYILTAEHVLSDAQRVWVTTDSGEVYEAHRVGVDSSGDLAMLKIDAKGLRAVQFAPTVQRGQWVLTLGNPYGLATSGELACAVGIISATNRHLGRLSADQHRNYTGLLQMTAPINPGNSGGPLFDLDGQVVGINAAVVPPSENANGIGFAFPITAELRAKIDLLKHGQNILPTFLGVNVLPVEQGRAGARIDLVRPGTPSDISGLRVGDVVQQIDGRPVRNAEHFVRLSSSLPAGKAVDVYIVRNGHGQMFQVTPAVQ